MIFIRTERNRKCLSKPPLVAPKHAPITWKNLEDLIDQINENCGTFRKTNGQKNNAGLHKATIEANLFNFDGPRMNRVRFERKPKEWEVTDRLTGKPIKIAQCEVIDAKILPYDTFRHEYLEQSRPVIIKNAVSHWPAFQLWGRNFFAEKYSLNKIHVKLGVNGVFEGPELRKLWEKEKNSLPENIREQLEFPDLVMARPGHVDLEMDQIVAMFQNETRDPIRDKWLSAYIEYTPISSHFDELKKHVKELDYFKELKLRHQNIWIGDGQTLGKMHFDEFENAMVMIKGRKQFLVFDPRDNKNLYEGHIPEARFEVKNGTDLRYALHRIGIEY